jgi:hypothetical protein
VVSFVGTLESLHRITVGEKLTGPLHKEAGAVLIRSEAVEWHIRISYSYKYKYDLPSNPFPLSIFLLGLGLVKDPWAITEEAKRREETRNRNVLEDMFDLSIYRERSKLKA